MSKYPCLILLLLGVSITLMSQTPYVSFKDEKHPNETILNGIVTKYALQNDTAYKWYSSSRSSFVPDKEIVTSLESAKDKVQFILFGGTWCEDTQFILPKFFMLQEQSGFPDHGISFFAVNRAKKTLGNFAEAFKITNVPTIIVMKDGLEVGRVVEYGKTGKWDKELMELIK